MKFAAGFLVGAVLVAVFFLLISPRELVVLPEHGVGGEKEGSGIPLPEVPESTISPLVSSSFSASGDDLLPQKPLANPPVIVRGIYLTNWSAGSKAKMKSIFEVIERHQLNGVVIDVKDYSGYVAYQTTVELARESGATDQVRIARPNTLIRDLHSSNVYAIGRISAFQDSVLAEAHPEWALKNKQTGKLWKDRKGLAWLDPSARSVWKYLVDLSKDARARGFDEINFDYVRFPSDGNLDEIEYPFWSEQTPRHEVIAEFFRYLRSELPDALISADLFGLATIERSDLGIGQLIEDAYGPFDFVSPMVYPSHYADGFLGYTNPAAHPYEIVKYSMEHALSRLKKYELRSVGTTTVADNSKFVVHNVRIRPWLQVFDLGATYTREMIQEQTRAVEEVLREGSSTAAFAGWLFWDPRNDYNNL